MTSLNTGKLLFGDEYELRCSVDAWAAMPIDARMPAPADWQPDTWQTTLRDRFYVTGPGTYSKRSHSTLYFEPFDTEGWWIDRIDLDEQLPIKVSVRNVWTTSRNIVLRSGSPHNYLRMTEHIIALRLGLGIDNAVIRIDTGDPPLFDVGSMPIVKGVERAGLIQQTDRPLTYYTVKEPVTVTGPNGSFLHMSPTEGGDCRLSLDVAIDFPTAIGQQRIAFDLCDEAFKVGAQARTNCSLTEVLFSKTVGKFLADVRNLGYTRENILIAGRRGYLNEPRLVDDGKSLEAVWHRAVLDLVAALSLVDSGRLAGKIVSYKAGHTLDARFVTQLYLQDLLEPVTPAAKTSGQSSTEAQATRG